MRNGGERSSPCDTGGEAISSLPRRGDGHGGHAAYLIEKGQFGTSPASNPSQNRPAGGTPVRQSRCWDRPLIPPPLAILKMVELLLAAGLFDRGVFVRQQARRF